MEHSLSELVAKREDLNRDENLQYNVFSTLRDYLCLELLSPEITEQHKLAFIAPFMELMRQWNNQNEPLSSRILRNLIAPGSVLAENIH